MPELHSSPAVAGRRAITPRFHGKHCHQQPRRDPIHAALRVLAKHVGAERPAAAASIARALRIAPSAVPDLVLRLRLCGIAVCGDRRGGYYIAAKAGELRVTCDWYRDKAILALTVEAALRHITLAELVGMIAAQEGAPTR